MNRRDLLRGVVAAPIVPTLAKIAPVAAAAPALKPLDATLTALTALSPTSHHMLFVTGTDEYSISKFEITRDIDHRFSADWLTDEMA